ncbi:tripartite tricarboxylate transporter TctB family protein [Sediminibacillus albus]|uniref:5,10-methylene-tetrahydrofolate dehydrogenase n=1 Tax=Sediminibacillus albus TaxID=407036 RepID=A0A1G8Y3P7_9BACI|nr:tripartite tricarboxylate transporter TctB family protein [Sediminibacillus albus]SDJ97458.1 hypothetical protein SAMN05216243_1389 [Sediminibacillus albus]
MDNGTYDINQESIQFPPVEGNNHTSFHARMHTSSITLGLVPAPDLAEDIANKLVKELPGYLPRYVDSTVPWEVEIVTDPLTGSTADASELMEETIACKKRQRWDYAICITDLPIFKDKRLVVAEASASQHAAWISLPALGASPMIRRVQEAITQLTNEMYHGSSETAREHQQKKFKNSNRRYSKLRLKGARQLVGERLHERLSPIRRATLEKDADITVHYTVDSKISGGWRMLTGMVRANRPWTIFPAFKRVIAAAFATGAYGLIFPTLWQLSGAYEYYRFILLMATAVTAMVAWIIVVHGLWEKTDHARSPYIAKLYNLATILTLSIAVLFYYGVLFILFLLAVIIFVPASMLESQIGAQVNLSSYVSLAWLASSVATIVGALGAALESEETVRNATYGYRQRRRSEEKDKEKEENHRMQ